jgi:hypothetical protein
VELHGEVPAATRQVAHQGLTLTLVHRDPLVADHTRGQHDDVVDGRRPTAQELGVEVAAQQRDPGIGVGRPQRLEGRQRNDEVAQRVGPQDGDPLDARDDGSSRLHPQPSSRRGLSRRKKLLWLPSRFCCLMV